MTSLSFYLKILLLSLILVVLTEGGSMCNEGRQAGAGSILLMWVHKASAYRPCCWMWLPGDSSVSNYVLVSAVAGGVVKSSYAENSADVRVPVNRGLCWTGAFGKSIPEGMIFLEKHSRKEGVFLEKHSRRKEPSFALQALLDDCGKGRLYLRWLLLPVMANKWQ